MLKLLMITIELPYPPNAGGRIKSWNMLQYLTKHFEVGLVCPLKYGQEYLDEFRSKTLLREFYYDVVEKDRSASNLMKSYINGIPLNVYRSSSRNLKETVAEIADNYDILLLDHYEAYQYVPKSFRGKVVLHTHNATYLMWERYSKSDANLAFRLATGIEADRVRTYERTACLNANQVYAAPNDIENLSGLGVCKSKFRFTSTPGDDTQLDLPPINFDKTDNTLFYVGTLNWEANVDGLLWFFDTVWQGLKAKNPEIRLNIAGGNIDPRLLEATKNLQDINFLGFVEDLEPLFQNSKLTIAPLKFGSGIKVKVLNSMCRGLPTVTTSVGAEGLGAKHMEHLAIADEPEEMIEAISRLLVDKQLWMEFAKNSRALIQERHTWKSVLGQMVQEMTELVAEETASAVCEAAS